MKLYLVHCGFYDLSLCEGVYESHVNLLVAAPTFDEARARVREDDEFRKRKMHVDGLQEVALVSGFEVSLTRRRNSTETLLIGSRHRDL